jgi:hypothetical protein
MNTKGFINWSYSLTEELNATDVTVGVRLLLGPQKNIIKKRR